ncbi:hypothetical protein F5B22DRAFT_652741 [Xylaria bambusicola]|uniref:uncharacterized protein n=1 Tax=Xylaria bambusicola TaxID=326684 RepID=UPI002008A05E|nr:uncharacterized protein F5B22DRAFT_652741 [Xylaria bambusicola]KAI0502776.1 hypothetical protein F5B22DRAFT_652741 [Xylaria bambusicola]
MELHATTSFNEYGRRLLPHVIDDIAKKDPNREAFMSPRSNNPEDGWAITTFSSYANAINRCAHEIVNRHGEATQGEFPTIAYIGPQDARYLVIVIAAIKAGYKVLLISPRNTQQAQISLFEKTNCSILWLSDNMKAVVDPWLLERHMETLVVKPLEEWFSTEDVPHFPFQKTFEQGEWEPFCVLHTSGSTGLPKPVILKQGVPALADKWHTMPSWEGSQYWHAEWCKRVNRYFTPMPLFHSAGLCLFFYNSVYWNTTTVLGFPDRPVTADLVRQCLTHTKVEGAVLPPSILEDMCQDSCSVAALSNLNAVLFGGGQLSKSTGDRLVKQNVRLINLIAATESGSWPLYFVERSEDWQYFKINSDVFGADWRHVHEGCYELVIKRKDQHPGFQGFFYTFPELQEYSTKDLYKPHPTLPNHWMSYGRADNIIVFSNGEKLNPITIEQTIEGHPEIKSAVVIGSNKFQAGLLLEPTQDLTNEEKCELIDRVWCLVEQVNRDTVAHGRITKELITTTNRGKPFPRAGKGTIQRSNILKLYAEEIDQLYKQAEAGSLLHITAVDIDVDSEESLTGFVSSVFKSLAQGTKLDPDTDFFSAGIDSLHVMNASRVFRASISKAPHTFDPNLINSRTVYNNPTPAQLARHIKRLIARDVTVIPNGEATSESDTAKRLYRKYTRHFIKSKPNRPEAPEDNQTVLLTGSTGNLGAYLLDQLVRTSSVSKVICCNRASDGGAQQQKAQIEKRGLLAQNAGYATKVEYLKVDLSRKQFGISDDKYERLKKQVHRVIHNAWPVNFNFSIETFEPHIRGVRNIADFAAQADRRVAVVFISSVASVSRWPMSRGPVPEKRLEDWDLPGNSYGRSKMCGSLILEDAALAGDFPAASIRVGQIAGSEEELGLWNRHEWLPSIVASSVYLKALPYELGSSDCVDWVSVERVAQLVLDVIGAVPTRGRNAGTEEISGYFHAVNDSVTSWGDLAPAVKQFYKDQIKELVSFKDWVDRLEESDSEDVEVNPGLKLLDTYREMTCARTPPLVLDLERTNKRSQAMREAPMISPELMTRWCKQWAAR